MFLPEDVKHVPYYYAYDQIEQKAAYCRRLRDIRKRLELLGYSLAHAERLYQDIVSKFHSDAAIDFPTFFAIIKSLDIHKINKIVGLGEIVDRHLNDLFESLDPYIILRLLMEKPENIDLNLYWRHADVVDAGWVSETDIYETVSDQEKFLLVTEGSSDSFIVRRAFQLLSPEIMDFFTFVDMADNYPFTGTGHLYRFCQGLTSIRILNKVVVIYDNDTIGQEKYELTKSLNLPPNMKVMKLPELDEFREFQTLGPTRHNKEDINGRAVAIEHFLDLHYKSRTQPAIRWDFYHDKMGTYHGSLVKKDSYIRKFQTVRSASEPYNFNKLQVLLDCIYNTCISI